MAGMTSSGAHLLNLEQYTIVVTIDTNLFNFLDVARSFTLFPELISRSGPVVGNIGLQGLSPGLIIGVSHHEHLPGFNRESAYCSTLEALCAGQPIESGLVEMTMAAVHTCLYQHWELAVHIRRAYACGVPELELAEALSLTMFPASVPYFIEACSVWRELIRQGEVAASESLSAWADIS